MVDLSNLSMAMLVITRLIQIVYFLSHKMYQVTKCGFKNRNTVQKKSRPTSPRTWSIELDDLPMLPKAKYHDIHIKHNV